MKKYILLIFMLTCSALGFSQVDFNQWFLPKSIRIDYFLTGDAKSQNIFFDGLSEEQYWSGSPNSLIDPFSYGSYKVEVKDKETGKLIYSRGFCTLFQEWQTIEEAKTTPKAFEQVTRIPYPKKPVIVEFFGRQRNGLFNSLYKLDVDPNSIFVVREKNVSYPVTQIVANGKPEQMLDITFIAEGYMATQMEKFKADVKHFYDYLITQEPFSRYKDKINIWAVESPSEQEGPDNPGKNVWNRTPVGSTFYTFGIDRYLTTTKFKSVMNVASNAPGDLVYIIINSSDYGGGGIYNHYNVATSNHKLSDKVFIHELGHGIVGLGDEYIDSDNENFYPKEIEPWEPNLTTLVNFDSKWKSQLDQSVVIPTPAVPENSDKLGVFEGGGYVEKGIYRPMMECRMRSNSRKGFCKVCASAIEKMLKYYTE